MTDTTNLPRLGDRLANFARDLSSFVGDQAGASFVIAALSFPVLLGMAGLGLDAVTWYQDKRHNQTLADNAAVAGTIALSRDATITQGELETIVRTSTAGNGFVNGTHGTVIVNSPPTAGPNAGTPGFVEVFVRKQGALYFSSMIVDAPITIETRAVGGVSTFGEHCVVALDETADGAITVIGTADVISDCGLASNSSSDQAILVTGKAYLDAEPLQAYGDIDKQGAADWVSKFPPQPLSERVDDPYADVLTELQAGTPCVDSHSSPSSPLPPGRYCGGININGNIDFQPGLFILDGGGLKITGGGDIRGPGVTFVLTASDASELGNFDVSGGGLLELRSPTAEEADNTGGYAGMLVIQDPYVPNLDTANLSANMLTGGSNMHLNGALYFPDMETKFAGGNGGGADCTLIVSKKVTFTGSSNLHNEATACKEAGVETISQTRVRLME